MLTILLLLIIALTVSIPLSWLLEHNGSVVVSWLNYQIQTDVFTAVLMAVFFTFCIVFISYIFTRILAIRFPALLKFFFRRTYLNRLEKIVARHHEAFEIMTQTMLALEIGDAKTAQNLQSKFAKLIKHRSLNNFFLGKIFFLKQEFSRACETFEKFGENKYAKILVLKSKFRIALSSKDDTATIAYAKQILVAKPDSFDVAKTLFALYKKHGFWQDAKSLIAQYGSENFAEELQKRDIAVINSALALEHYQKRNFSAALKHAKIALKAENNFLPAIEIMLKCWIKRGFIFKVRWMIKNLWKENPHLIFAEIFDLTNRKSSAKNRIKLMKKMVQSNPDSTLAKLAIGLVSFRVGEYQIAKEFLNLSIKENRNYRACKLLAFTEKNLNNETGFKQNLKKLELLEKDDHYLCNSCGHLSARWSAKCSSCDSYDSLEFNF